MLTHFGQLSEEELWIPGTLRLCEVSDCLVLIPGWRASAGAMGERTAFDGWGRGDRIFYLDQFPIDHVDGNDDYAKLRTWIAGYRA